MREWLNYLPATVERYDRCKEKGSMKSNIDALASSLVLYSSD